VLLVVQLVLSVVVVVALVSVLLSLAWVHRQRLCLQLQRPVVVVVVVVVTPVATRTMRRPCGTRAWASLSAGAACCSCCNAWRFACVRASCTSRKITEETLDLQRVLEFVPLLVAFVPV
jgi:hypothetical protein